MPDTQTISPDAHIESCPKVQTNIRWPAPVDLHLNELVDELEAATAGVITRSQLLAALVARAPNSGPDLEQMMRDYRNLTAGDVVLHAAGGIEHPVRRPGRRARRP